MGASIPRLLGLRNNISRRCTADFPKIWSTLFRTLSGEPPKILRANDFEICQTIHKTPLSPNQPYCLVPINSEQSIKSSSIC